MILTQHGTQRRMFAMLDDIQPSDTDSLSAVWGRLAALLEVHARAEELYFYPRLLHVGTGAGGEGSAKSETKDAIKDHNQIRDGIRRASEHPVASEEWWKAVLDTRNANSDHMAEEEREDLPDFRHHADLQSRHDIAVAFVRFESEHAAGITAEDQDPDSWVRRNS